MNVPHGIFLCCQMIWRRSLCTVVARKMIIDIAENSEFALDLQNSKRIECVIHFEFNASIGHHLVIDLKNVSRRILVQC